MSGGRHLWSAATARTCCALPLLRLLSLLALFAAAGETKNAKSSDSDAAEAVRPNENAERWLRLRLVVFQDDSRVC
jgi:hypothetical protein